MNSTTELLEEIAAIGGEVGNDAARLLPLMPPKLCDHPGDEYLDAVRLWMNEIDRVVWRAQADPVLRPHCEEFMAQCPPTHADQQRSAGNE